MASNSQASSIMRKPNSSSKTRFSTNRNSSQKGKSGKSLSKPDTAPVLVLLNKPFNTLCQFTGEDGDSTLADYVKIKSVYPAGRLDKDSEGLLLLTNDGNFQHKISHPKFKMPKTYWVQVDGVPDDEAIGRLRQGVVLKDGKTKRANVQILESAAVESRIWERTPPIRQRQSIPTTWIELIIREGKNRQVRRMTAAVGHPTLRLIRVSIGPWKLADLLPGEYQVEPLD